MFFKLLSLFGLIFTFLAMFVAHFFVGTIKAIPFDNIHWTLGYSLGALFAWRSLKKSSALDYEFKLWLTRALAALAIGQLLWDWQVFSGWNPFPGPSDFFYLMLGLFCIFGLWVLHRNRCSVEQMRALPFDITTISVSFIAFILVIYLPLGIAMNVLQLVVLVAYPVFLLTAACLSCLFILRVVPKFHWGWLLTLFSFCVQGYAWMEWNLLTLKNLLDNGTFFNMTFSLSAITMGLGIYGWKIEPSKNIKFHYWCAQTLRILPLIGALLISFAILLVNHTQLISPLLRNIVSVSTVVVLLVIVVRQTWLLFDSELLRKAEQQIHHLAFYDPLTHLPNRRLFNDKLRQILATRKEQPYFGAIVYIDIDHFKHINDTKGHGHGDLLLIQVAQRIKNNLSEDDTVARLGGDEFVVILNYLHSERDVAANRAERVAERLSKVINEPFQLENMEHHASASIGITLFYGSDESPDELLKRADSAMYQAKNAGRNTLKFFDPVMQAELESRLALESWMRDSANDHYELHYQLQVNEQGKPLGAEVLIRMRHPTRGLISPLEFIPLAEETGLIIPIGEWVIKTACEQLKLWEAHSDLNHLHLSVNLSARQLREPNFVSTVESILNELKINPKLLIFEITESMAMTNVEETILKMNALRELGIRFSVDDFGTGQSSLSYLTRLPLNELKIDRSFVNKMLSNKNDAVIVQTIIAMAKALGFDVIAEGVETKEQRDFLISQSCFNFQGYYFSKPLSIGDFSQLLEKQI